MRSKCSNYVEAQGVCICRGDRVLLGNSTQSSRSPSLMGTDVAFRESWESFRAWKQGLSLHPEAPLSSAGAWSVCCQDSCHNWTQHVVTLTHSNKMWNECVNGARVLAFVSPWSMSESLSASHLSTPSRVMCNDTLSNGSFATLFLRTSRVEFLQDP